MKFLSTVLLVGFLSHFSVAQNQLVILHQAVGDEIDLEEKKMYLLFEEIDNAHFETGTIVQEKGIYYLNYCVNHREFSKEISKEKLEEYHLNIEKLLAYQIYLKNPEKFKEKPLIVRESRDTCSLEMDIEYLSRKQRKQLKRAIHSSNLLNEQAQIKGYTIDKRGQYIKSSSKVILQPAEWFLERRY